jgi:hypothetical protein
MRVLHADQQKKLTGIRTSGEINLSNYLRRTLYLYIYFNWIQGLLPKMSAHIKYIIIVVRSVV